MSDDKPRPAESAAWRAGRAVAKRLVPERLLEQRRAARKGELFGRAGVAFIHVPRAGGTSVANALYGGHIGHFPVRDLLSESSDEVLALPRFTVVRDPWERAVSAWQFARAGSGKGGQEAAIANPGLYKDERFGSFARFVEEFLLPAEVDRLDPVFRRQSWYVGTEPSAAFDHVGRLEALEDTQGWLSDTLGREIAIGRHNRSNTTDWRAHYDARLAGIIGDIYAADAESFGYAF